MASASTPTSSGAYIPPHLSSNSLSSVQRNGDARYSKEQLLEMYKAQREAGYLSKHVEDYFVADWDPHTVSTPTNGAWGKRDDHKSSAGPEVCWDHGGQAEPLGLTDMSDGEKEVRSASSATISQVVLVVVGANLVCFAVVLRLGQFSSEAATNQRRKGECRPRDYRSQVVDFVHPRPRQYLPCRFSECRAPARSPP